MVKERPKEWWYAILIWVWPWHQLGGRQHEPIKVFEGDVIEESFICSSSSSSSNSSYFLWLSDSSFWAWLSSRFNISPYPICGGVLSREALNHVSEVDSIGFHVPGFDLHYLRSFTHHNNKKKKKKKKKKSVPNLQYTVLWGVWRLRFIACGLGVI